MGGQHCCIYFGCFRRVLKGPFTPSEKVTMAHCIGLLRTPSQFDCCWLQKRTYVLAILRDVQVVHGKKPLTVICAVLTHWTAHYLAYRCLLELQPTLKWIINDDELHGNESCLITGSNAKTKQKSRETIELIKDGLFWHSLARMKRHLEPLAIAVNVTQAAHCRLDQVLLTFGLLYAKYSKLDVNDVTERDVRQALLNSIEEQWSKADQDVFIAAIILNPFFRTYPFAPLHSLTNTGIYVLFERLWR
ncbi:hypothetical protein AcV7_006723 [Taiwanofungus camphoratus]|nr:hypothetical protein AcV7_006723 [Antrodia cinnamomea]